MHVLVNVTGVAIGGGITVPRELLRAFVETDEGNHRYTVACRAAIQRNIDPHSHRVQFLTVDAGEGSMGARLAWEQLALPVRAATLGADVLLSPFNLSVLAAPIPQVLMFQNVAPFTRDVVEAYDESGEHRIARRLKLLRRLGIISAHRARRVVFISRAQEATILPQLNIAPDRASVIYTGWDKRFTPEAKSSAAPFLRRHGIGPRYLLSVSHMYRYKNLVELVRGYSIAAKGLPDDVQLVLVGAEPEANYATAVRRAVDESGLAGRVRILGHVPSDDLPPLYAAASMFLFPSTCESFPNILLEALASGAPTLTSNMCSMPEIATNGADYFDPRSPDELASRILSLWNAPTRRTALALAGVARAQQFSWNRMAEELLLLLRNESRALGRSR